MMHTTYCTEESKSLDALACQSFELLAGFVPSTRAATLWPHPLMYSSVVSYEGKERGAVMISCDDTFAFDFTATFMQIPRPRQFDEDTRDALGELANTIGGNYKGLLGPDTHLSTPVVNMSTDPPDVLEVRELAACVTYTFDRGTCEVRLLK